MFSKNEVKKFLNPKSIAIIGASETEGKVGFILMNKISNFKGKVFPVNLNKKTILGIKAYKSVKEIPFKVDLAVIATPSNTVDKILIECGIKKIKSVIIITAGFAEVKNNLLQEELLKIAKKYKIRVLGPNCFGVANPYLNLDTTFSKTIPKKGNTAFISQSGALWSFISDIKGIGFSGFVSIGNMVDLGFTEFIKYFNKDKKTKRIILYVEKIKNGREFIELCKKSKKEIIVVKEGKSKEGSKAAMSHTASLATDYNVYKGAFRQAKIKVSDSLYNAITGKSKNISFPKSSKKNKTIIVTNAGGAGTLISDLCEENKFNLIQSPIDILGTASPEDYKKTLDKLKNKKVDVIMVALTPQQMSQPKKVAEKISEFSKENKNKRVIAFFLGENSVKESWNILKKNRIEIYGRI